MITHRQTCQVSDRSPQGFALSARCFSAGLATNPTAGRPTNPTAGLATNLTPGRPTNPIVRSRR